MEGLGAAASVTTLIVLCKHIIGYLKDVKDASADRTRLLMQVRTTSAILKTLKETTEWSAALLSLPPNENPLQQLHDALKQLNCKLSSSPRVRDKFLWPFNKGDVDRSLTAIDRQTGLLKLVLQSDHIAVSRQIQADIQPVKSNAERSNRHALLEWLTPVDHFLYKRDIFAKRQPGTGEWLLRSNEYHKWVTEDRQTLFCPGIPGAGKTFIATMVIDSLYASYHAGRPAGMACLFCNFRRQHEQTTETLLACILKQLVSAMPTTPKPLQELWSRHESGRYRLNTNDLLNALEDTIALHSRTYIIIDALDECQVSGTLNREFLQRFSTCRQKRASIFSPPRNTFPRSKICLNRDAQSLRSAPRSKI
jgi:hypothetical protein